MNEPACFNNNEGTFPKNNLHNLGDGETVEHRLVHNAYGFFNTQGTS
jgi:mannosyl-oligosaccharide alpha-1,3-glucosidase